MTKWRRRLVVACLGSVLYVSSSVLLASAYYHVSMGVGLSKLGKASNLILTSAITDRYIANRSSKLVMLFSAGGGYRFQLSSSLKLAVGLAGFHINFGSHGGILHPGFNLNPNFDVLNYSYRVSSTALWQEQYWIFGPYRWKPYLFMGVGITWNHLFDYFESASNTGGAAPVLTPFHSYTQAHVVYGFGMGIHYVLHNQTRVDVGYRYINLGSGSLGSSPIQTTDARLRVNNLYAHMITLSLYLK